MANPNPGQISNEMWNFWLAFKKLEPSVQLGGIYANKPGYHNTRNALPGSDYSVGQYALDRRGPGDKAAAIDLTMPPAQMHKYSQRLLASGRNMKDERGNYMREFYGNIGNDGYVDGWDFQAVCNSSSDDSHMWHVHISVLRAYLNDAKCFRAILSILSGESVVTWRAKEAARTVVRVISPKPVAKPLPVPPKPAAPAPVYHTVRGGQTLSGIADAYHTTLAKLLALNPAKKRNPNALNIGEKIRVK